MSAKPDIHTDVTAVILAAGEIPVGLRPVCGKSCISMVPLNGRPLIYWIIKYLKNCGIRKFVIAVRQKDSFLEQFVSCLFNGSIQTQFVIPDKDLGPAYSLYYASQSVDTPKGLVVLGDTFFKFTSPKQALCEESFILYDNVEDSSPWCMVEEENNQVLSFYDKPKENHQLKTSKALIGVYGFNKWNKLQQSLNELCQNTKDNKELSEILDHYRGSTELKTVAAEQWFDCGNAHNLMTSRRDFFQKRFFNTLERNPLLGTISKKSEISEKFLDEINYYSALPAELNILFPRVIKAQTKQKPYQLELEYYGYPTLAEVYVFESPYPSVWRRLFQHLSDLITYMQQYSQEDSYADQYFMYITRIEERITALKRESYIIKELIECPNLVINGQQYKNFDQLWPRITQNINTMIKDTTNYVIHGDMCFSNILYNFSSDIIKFVDPRGSFGQKGIYGDSRYDIAKLFHSTHGLYDFITNDLFDINVEENIIHLEIFTPDSVQTVQKEFEQIFFEQFKRSEITLITGLLFVSMGVFHHDYPARQQAFYCQGIKFLNEVYNEDLY